MSKNYIEQIKGFWIMQEINQLSSSEIAMYFYLLETWNKTGWIGCFRRNNYKVMADLSIKSYKTLQSIRDKLQSSGIISFKQRNGEANVEYLMADLGKFYQGSGKGSGKGSVEGSGKGNGEGLGEDNINQTKQKRNQTSKSHSGDKAPVSEKLKLPFWKKFVEIWHEWYKSKFNEAYGYLERDFANLKRIYKFLEKRAEQKKFEFTEENLASAFNYFLNKAWEKDEWLRTNFSVSNVLSQFNAIANGATKSTNQTKQSTGANVDTGSMLAKINAMPD